MSPASSQSLSLVTGATGFVGSWVASLLVESGETIRCLRRKESSTSNLPPEGPKVQWAIGDLLDPSSLDRAMEGVGTLYHVAADYRLWSPKRGDILHSNVTGTRNILDAALRAGVSRVVYCSSVAALGARTDGVPIDESMDVDRQSLVGEYKISKYEAEQVALSYADRLSLVVVNPSAPIGARDIKPTPTGRIVLDYLKGRMKASIHTGLNVVHVRDVARGHLLAARDGKAGEKYILAGRNMTLCEVFRTLETVTGIPAPKVTVPRGVVLPLALLSEGVSRLTGREPMIPLEGVRMAKKLMYYDGSRAVRELGLVVTPVEEAFRDAVRYYASSGYLEASLSERLLGRIA
ncbi:MAG: NAD-dependent epimerase/dehydratase family protein [Nitrospirae bacterium]|nr:NAD-dependent epimerase/dehydratase family protein [Nitrospirota bacterium]MCL5285026.1 NAD-dependent epimerase/dehydratase family protein [Nitrospirota bacterium]